MMNRLEAIEVAICHLSDGKLKKGLRDGTIRTVVSTNALELGVDIGQLQACIMTGYPGNIASAWQQAGRAGRRQDEALIIYVAQSRTRSIYY